MSCRPTKRPTTVQVMRSQDTQSYRRSHDRPNQSLQPTAGRSDEWLPDNFNIKLRSKVRSRQRWLSSVSLGDCDGHLCVHRPALARQTLIETKTGAAVQIFSD
jgi:hypothetical protein